MFDLPGVKPDSDIETLFKAVGFVVVQWGHAEQSLDLMVASIFGSFSGHPLPKRRPQHLEPKINFLGEYFAKLPELEEFRFESELLLPRFVIAGRKRNDLVHGAISEFSIRDGAFTFLKIDVSKENHRVRTVFLDNSD